eukprot:COSAG02_NODE_70944_length_193_cov_25.904255_1_plen_64_part_11
MPPNALAIAASDMASGSIAIFSDGRFGVDCASMGKSAVPDSGCMPPNALAIAASDMASGSIAIF